MSTTWVAMPSFSSCLAAWMPSQVAGSLMSTLSWLTPFALNSASRLWARSRRAAAGQHEPGQPVELGRLLGSCTPNKSGPNTNQKCSKPAFTQRRPLQHAQGRPLGGMQCHSRAQSPPPARPLQASIHSAGYTGTAKLTGTMHTVGLLSANLHHFCTLSAIQQDITPQ